LPPAPYLPAAGSPRPGLAGRPARPHGATGAVRVHGQLGPARTWPPRCGAGPAASRRSRPAPIPVRRLIAAALRHRLPLPRLYPRHISEVRARAMWWSRCATLPARNSAARPPCTDRSRPTIPPASTRR